MRVLILTAQTPFIQGGAEILTSDLRRALIARGFSAEVVAIPATSRPDAVLECALGCRMLGFGDGLEREADLVIGMKFPAYLARHSNKVLWIMHQYRQAYDCFWTAEIGIGGNPAAHQVSAAIRHADHVALCEARRVFSISQNVSDRLMRFNACESIPLMPPPRQPQRFRTASPEPYLFFPSRISPLKRQSLALQALTHTTEDVRLRFAGAGDSEHLDRDLQQLTTQLGIEDRVEWLGQIGDDQLIEQYARCLGVVFPPIDEDYGYVTLEAMLASKPVITCTDSGEPQALVVGGVTGLVADPSPEALAAAFDSLWSDTLLAVGMGIAGRRRYEDLSLDWDRIVDRLTAGD